MSSNPRARHSRCNGAFWSCLKIISHTSRDAWGRPIAVAPSVGDARRGRICYVLWNNSNCTVDVAPCVNISSAYSGWNEWASSLLLGSRTVPVPQSQKLPVNQLSATAFSRRPILHCISLRHLRRLSRHKRLLPNNDVPLINSLQGPNINTVPCFVTRINQNTPFLSAYVGHYLATAVVYRVITQERIGGWLPG
jgi:hypothetical protein